MRILHAQIKSSEEAEESFQTALQAHPLIARDIKPMWLEWLVLTKGIIRLIFNFYFYFVLIINNMFLLIRQIFFISIFAFT